MKATTMYRPYFVTPRSLPIVATVIILSVFSSVAIFLAAARTAFAQAPQQVTLFAAASTTNAITEINTLFEGHGYGKPVPSFASSSTLAKQIENGAPADIFLSANETWMDYLAEKDLIETDSRKNLLGNRIVLIAPADSALDNVSIGQGFHLADLLGQGRLSMGDPVHVPAGIYGKQALDSLGVWHAVESKIAPAKDVRSALVLVERGEAPLGLVYATDAAISHKVRVVGIFPETSHPAIIYPVAIIKDHLNAAAKDYLRFLKAPEARRVFEKYGFHVR